MTNQSYTDEQVRDLIELCSKGPTQAGVRHMGISSVLRSLLANRQRLQAEVEALRSACMAMIEWDEAEQTHAVDFHKRMDMCRDAFDKARSALALSHATPNETKEAKS